MYKNLLGKLTVPPDLLAGGGGSLQPLPQTTPGLGLLDRGSPFCPPLKKILRAPIVAMYPTKFGRKLSPMVNIGSSHDMTYMPCYRNCSSHVRTKQQIEATGAYHRDQFVPAPQTKFSQFDSLIKHFLTSLL